MNEHDLSIIEKEVSNIDKTSWYPHELYLLYNKQQILSDMYIYRSDFNSKFTYCIPTREVLFKIAQFENIIEIGAGCGYLAFLLNKHFECDIIATDILDPLNNKWTNKKEPWTNIEILSGVDAVKKYPKSTLLTCWPPYNDSLAFDALTAYKGKNLIYIGEDEGGCTGCDNFHNLLSTDWKRIECIRIPNWKTIHDAVFIYKRIEQIPMLE